ncbi:homeobox and leucine zipper encoding b [Acanthochromis polyacanthus]|uniref:homeobox and leucine zipper encoding b n=1 Tax=Acanthochromis polyacanthus TaxID=80966 RepID=UPI002233FFC0|nr:homeobox and leucine zipper encoding b [Acanthochromis polyacanthus]
MNRMSAMCLPLLSESNKIIWVKSEEVDLQMKGAAELHKAFNRFPYLTRRQMTALAQRCSLHPDQVKVWFMTRRLQYGISWEYRDVLDVWRNFKSPQTNAQKEKELLNIVKENVKEGRGKRKRKTRSKANTPPQLAMMKTAFSHCQYPDPEQYDRLAELIGVRRCTLVQWFADMRYYLKKGRPRWMNQEKYNQALANIKYRQYINAMAKVEPSEGAMMVE